MSGSSSVSTPPVHVTLTPVVFHILLLSSGMTYPAEILTGWQISEACYDNPHPCELTHFNFADDHDLLIILKLLDKVRDGFFQVVLVLPPASSWSRARHVGPEGQPPIRSRSRPWGVIEASSAQYSKLLHDNRTAEISTWFAEQSLLREEPRTALIYIFPEDFGGHFSTGPASLWSLQELRVLHGTHDALRGATFLCRICGSDRKKPLGILTNLPGLQEALSLGLPILKMHGSFLQYHGPLPKSCGCSPLHPPSVGISSSASFLTVEPFGAPFWKFCFSCLRSPLVFNPVTVGDTADSQAATGSQTFSLSSLTESWTEVYGRWQRNKLTCMFLRDYTASPDLGSYFTRTRLDQTTWSDVPAPLVSPSTAAPSTLLRPTSSSLLSTGTSSQPSGPTEGPLTPSASRVVGDGNGARPPVAGSAEFPGFALYQSVLLIVSPFFFNAVLFKSRSRSVTVVSLKGSVSTALGAH